MIWNTEFRRNSVKIPYQRNTEFRKNGCVTLREGGVHSHWGSCHLVDRAAAADGQRGGDSEKIRSSVIIRNSAFFTEFRTAEFRILTEFRTYGIPYIRISVTFFAAEFREKIPQNSGGIPYHGIPLDTLV